MRQMRICAGVLVLLAAMMGMKAMAQGAQHKVIFALVSGDESDWAMTTSNLRNLQAGLAPDTSEIELVAYGPGVSFLAKGSSAAPQIAELLAKHIRFVACQNAMRAHHLTPDDLLPGVEMVPSGLVEVVKKQEQGWTYVKGGQ